MGVRSHRAPQCRAVDVTGCAAKLGGKEGGREAPEAELEKGVLQSALGQTRRALASPGPAAECAFCARASEVTHILLPTKGSIRREQTQDAGAKTGIPRGGRTEKTPERTSCSCARAQGRPEPRAGADPGLGRPGERGPGAQRGRPGGPLRCPGPWETPACVPVIKRGSRLLLLFL